MSCSITFLLVRKLLGLVGIGPSPDEKDVDIAVLPHQLAVRKRQVTRRLLERWATSLVTPAMLMRWHPRARSPALDVPAS